MKDEDSLKKIQEEETEILQYLISAEFAGDLYKTSSSKEEVIDMITGTYLHLNNLLNCREGIKQNQKNVFLMMVDNKGFKRAFYDEVRRYKWRNTPAIRKSLDDNFDIENQEKSFFTPSLPSITEAKILELVYYKASPRLQLSHIDDAISLETGEVSIDELSSEYDKTNNAIKSKLSRRRKHLRDGNNKFLRQILEELQIGHPCLEMLYQKISAKYKRLEKRAGSVRKFLLISEQDRAVFTNISTQLNEQNSSDKWTPKKVRKAYRECWERHKASIYNRLAS